VSNTTPVVSVCIIAYNQEQFIRQCIEGVIDQQLQASFEIIIGDDNSTDGTGSICMEYAQKFPQLINYRRRETNLGMMGNWIATIGECKGSYIAICEGDDYWTDKKKLQLQLDYISNHTLCNLVFTGVQVYDENEGRFYDNWAAINKRAYSFADVVMKNNITTCTILFRNPGNHIVANWLAHFKIADWPLYLLLLQSGYAYYLPGNTSVYRRGDTGVFAMSSSAKMVETNIEVLETFGRLKMGSHHFGHLRKSIVRWYYSKLVLLSMAGNYTEVRPMVKRKVKPSDFFFTPKCFLKIVLIFIFPKLKSAN
jgi:glycosyltransferase involved in cell wall biosynthesis